MMEADMPNTAKEPDGMMILDSRVVIQDVTELKARLTDLMDANEHIVIDASEVDSIDTAALQLLTAFTGKTAKQDMKLEWREPSASFADKARLLGLNDVLSLSAASEEPTGETAAADVVPEEEDDGLCPVF